MKIRVLSLLSSIALALFLSGYPTASAQTQIALSHGSRDEKSIALTFDDGPHPRYTQEVLDILDQYGIKATFFMIGLNVLHYPQIAQEVMKRGHEIGSHTFSHPHMLGLKPSEVIEELKKTEAVFEVNHIPKPTLFRPPEGYRTKEQSAAVFAQGYRMVVWSLDTHDWKSNPSEEIVRYVLNHVRGGDIILFHDYISGKNTTIAALKQLIPKLLERGYQFTVVSDLTI